ncbi:uncharacterized protein VICG_00288 [Vittaforma corneae ATCC 50505]|uniref:Uncharacterized protein n=1 Tax=Vittaforma corneae (strain ATCC 50505) TaxID=993615 RepID=L2GNX3_VITCO|nr:uncharacterized protein VICG_00288 [Vittaforma corneae ATCC 50505]ELA42536.1 hypothetical protein VICG_00288 [Vittaforma corneae ATCC 50505]
MHLISSTNYFPYLFFLLLLSLYHSCHLIITSLLSFTLLPYYYSYCFLTLSLFILPCYHSYYLPYYHFLTLFYSLTLSLLISLSYPLIPYPYHYSHYLIITLLSLTPYLYLFPPLTISYTYLLFLFNLLPYHLFLLLSSPYTHPLLITTLFLPDLASVFPFSLSLLIT